MIQFLSSKLSRYLLFFLFSLPVLGFISLIVETREIRTELIETVPSVTDSEETKREESSNPIIYISNFPVKNGYLSSGFGMRKDPFSGKKKMHQGIDIAARKGENIYPIGDGKVIFAGRKAGFGKMIEIQHGQTIVSRYSHLKKYFVKKNQKVTEEDIIAQVGSTGRSTGPHLHLEIAINGETTDPQIFLIGGLAKR